MKFPCPKHVYPFRLSAPRSPVLLALLLGLLVLTDKPASAQEAGAGNGVIEGRVLNLATGRYMTRAQIQIEGRNQRTFTNQFGEYELYGIPAGTYTLTASFTGQEPIARSVTVEAGSTVTRDFYFGSRTGDEDARSTRTDDEGQVFELAAFEVSSDDSFQTASEIAIQAERFSVNLINVVDTDAYGITAQGNVGEFVKYMPGVTIGYGGSNTAGGTYASGADANTISIRGYSARETSITIDGVPIANAAPGTLDPAVGLDMMSINNAARVEVIKVPSPDQPNAGVGGTVNLVSKSAFEYPKPTLNFRVYATMNSESMDIFEKTPGPMNKPTYKTQPGFDLTYAVPFSKTFGATVTVASSNQVNEEHSLKARLDTSPLVNRPSIRSEDATFSLGDGETYSYWLLEDPHFGQWQETYGEDWTQWTEDQFFEMYSAAGASEGRVRGRLDDIKRLPKYDHDGKLVGTWSEGDQENYEENLPLYYDADGKLVGRVLDDWGHRDLHRFQVTDSPRISRRNSGALKFDWRPLDGLILTTSYQISTFEDESANRRVIKSSGDVFEFGPDYSLSDGGGVRLDTDAFGREGTTQTGYLRAEYIKGPWQIKANVSRSESESDLVSIENGHFSVVEVSLGNIDYTEFLDINRQGVPQTVNYYRDVEDDDGNLVDRVRVDETDLSNYSIANFDPSDPDAGELRVRAAGINSSSEIDTAKLDIRRDLNFLPWDQHMNLAIKVGADWQKRTETKSGRGTNYEFVYLGQEGDILQLEDFRDDSYVGVDPGFGLEPLEWPDPFKLYDYAQENPAAFSDTDDRVPGQNQESVAAHNWLEIVNTSKSITETKTAYYAQLEGDFLKNRLSVVAGFRMEYVEREGYARGEDTFWRFLHRNEDADGDLILDVFNNYDDIEIDPKYGTDTLGTFDLTGPDVLLFELRRTGANAFDQLPPASQEHVLTWYQYYEQAGAVYPDGEPFIASEYVRLQPGSLKAYQYQYLKDYPVDQKTQPRPQPIISAAYDITDNLVARLSWSVTYSNPPYESSEGAAGTLRRVQFIENADGSGSMNVTNPSLDISKSTGWDAGLTYYTDTGGKYSVIFYYREEEDRAIEEFFSPSATPEAWDIIMRDLGYGPGTKFYENEWNVTTSVNAQGTFVDYGYELEARQDLGAFGNWGKYFYVYGSLFQQFQDAGDVPEDEEERGIFNIIPGTEMRLNASGGVSVTYGRYNLRVNATWRNERTADVDRALVDTIFWPDATVGNPGWYTASGADDDNEPYTTQMRLKIPEDFRVDITASIRLTDHLTLDFSARNVNNSNPVPFYEREDGGKLPLLGHIDDDSERTNYGVNFTIGISGTY